MNERLNEEVIKDYYQALGNGDFDRIIELHSPDLVCWMSGQSLVSGRFEGRDNLYAHMGKNVLGALVLGTESYVKGSRIVVVDGPFVVGLLHGGLPTSAGGRYDQFYIQLFRLEQGRIAEIVEFFDTVMVEKALMGNRLANPRPAPGIPYDIHPVRPVAAAGRDTVARIAGSVALALEKGDRQALNALLDARLAVKVIGSTPISGLREGAEALAAVAPGGFDEIRLICADESNACLLARTATASGVQQYGLILAVSGQCVTEIDIYLDTVLAEESLFGNSILPAPSRSVMPPFDISKALL